ncbi:MAG: type II secretion system F family protein [Bacillota bacterium]
MATLAAVLAGMAIWLLASSAFAPGPLGRLTIPERDRDWFGFLTTAEERVGEVAVRLLSRLGVNRLSAAGASSVAVPGNRTHTRRLGRRAMAAAAVGVTATATALVAGSAPSPLLVLAAAAAGGLLPGWSEGRIRRARAREIAASLPQFLDFLVVCQQAGLNLRGSLEEGALAAGGRLGREVRAVLDAVPPAQLVADLGEKYDSPELRALGGALRQGELLGIPLADILRSQAEGLREASRRRLQAASATAPLKLSLCTVCLFLPSVLALVLVPQLLVFLSRW